MQLTKVLLQAGRDVVIFGCSSLSASVVGRTSFAGLLFVIFYFYIFIHQRLGSDTAMNTLPDSNTRPLPAIFALRFIIRADGTVQHLFLVQLFLYLFAFSFWGDKPCNALILKEYLQAYLNHASKQNF